MKLILMDIILKVVVNLGRIKDITGEKYNRLTAIRYIGKDKHGAAIWLWKCDCGNEKEIVANSVKSGNTKSCGCLKKETDIKKCKAKIKDITGERFGFLVAKKYVGQCPSGAKWECLCDCGNITVVSLSHLKSGDTKSCGCYVSRNNYLKIKDKKFGKLTVIDFKYEKNNAKIICKCDCGNIVETKYSSLISGNTKSCGCFQKEKASLLSEFQIKDLSNQKFGELTPLRIFQKNKKGVIWTCQCSCGKILNVPSRRLCSGHTKSCGHILSFKEKEISDILRNNNIEFQQQFSFSDLKDKQPLRFDFAIFKENKLLFLIEYNGEQHYDETSYYYSDILVKHDKMKIDYCKEKNIKLLVLNKDNKNIEKDILENMKG